MLPPITRISIKNFASFDSQGIEFEPQKINFIYGKNSTGKTTIANVLSNISQYPSCNISWQQRPLEVLVYNRRFVHQNFGQSSDIKGIFNLGEHNISEIENIALRQKEIGLREAELQKYQSEIIIQNNDLEKLEKHFKEIKCWEGIYKKYEEAFSGAFKNYKTKEKFAEKISILCRLSSNQATLTYRELEAKSQTIFNDKAEKASEITKFLAPNFINLEQNSIFVEIIIGKSNVDIAGLIANLQNSDWVKNGVNYFKINNQNCPFCQQSITDDFRQQLDQYFDESYRQKIVELNLARDKYYLEGVLLLEKICQYQTLDHQFINLDEINKLKNIIQTTFEKNLLTINNKIKEPSLKIELDSLIKNIEELQKLIDQAILNTSEHNDLINNLKKEKDLLTNQIWNFIAAEAQDTYQNHNKDRHNIKMAIEDLQKNERLIKQKIRDLKSQINALEAKITSIKPAINTINQVLADVGFANFFLAEGEDKSSYKIIRQNGDDARKTLSEGEKTLITFLYFYHLTKGGFDQDEAANDRVVVLDDPISSLDDSTLLVVAQLTKQLIDDCQNGGKIKQFFVLTHNNNFWKELTDINGGSYFALTTSNNKSALKAGDWVAPSSFSRIEPIKTKLS